jgi:hypothetical protein
MALDAIANHSVSVNTLFSDAAAAYEDTLNRFAAWCAQTSSCPLHGRDVLALFDSVVQRADQQPITAPECADGSCRPTVTGGEIRMDALFLLLAKEGVPAIGVPGWNDFATALEQADQGDASRLSVELAASPLEFAGLAINCADYPPEIVTYEDFVAKTLLGRVVAPETVTPHHGCRTAGRATRSPTTSSQGRHPRRTPSFPTDIRTPPPARAPPRRGLDVMGARA